MGSTTTNQTQQTGPPSMFLPFTAATTQAATQQYGMYSRPLPFSTVVPFSPETLAAQGMATGYAGPGGAGSTLTGAGTDYITRELQGGNLPTWMAPGAAGANPNDPTNILATRAAQAATGPVAAMMAGAERTGSGIGAYTAADVGQGTAAQIYQQLFEAERQRQQSAAAMLPQTYQAGMAPAETIGAVGAQKEQKAGEYIQQQLQQYFAPQTALDNYMAQLQGVEAPYRTTTARSQTGQQTWQAILGGIGGMLSPMSQMGKA